eukprot:s1426_g12.t1
MSPSATPATQNEGRCCQVPRLPGKRSAAPQDTSGDQGRHQSQPNAESATASHAKEGRRHRTPAATKAVARANPALEVPRLPHKTKADVTKCHACRTKRRQMSPSATPATQKKRGATGHQRRPRLSPEPTQAHACHTKRRQMSPSATPATQNEGRCCQVPRLPRKRSAAPQDTSGDQGRHQSQPSAVRLWDLNALLGELVHKEERRVPLHLAVEANKGAFPEAEDTLEESAGATSSDSLESCSDEAAAEKIEQLTWEIQELLKDGHPELAAKLLADAEVRLLSEDEGNETLHGLKKAALHTLWAAVLEDIGEKDKAAKLYDEALTCLKHEDQEFDSASEISDDASHRSTRELLELHQQQRPLPIAEKMKLLMDREIPPEMCPEVPDPHEVKTDWKTEEVLTPGPEAFEPTGPKTPFQAPAARPVVEPMAPEAFEASETPPESLSKETPPYTPAEPKAPAAFQTSPATPQTTLSKAYQTPYAPPEPKAAKAFQTEPVKPPEPKAPKTSQTTAATPPEPMALKTFQTTPAAPPEPKAPKTSQTPPPTPPPAKTGRNSQTPPATPSDPKAAKTPAPSSSLVSPPRTSSTPDAKEVKTVSKAAPKKRPPPMAPMAPKVSGAVRVGGGFKLTPKAPSKAKAKVAPRAKVTAPTPDPVPDPEPELAVDPEPATEPLDLMTRLTLAAQKVMVTADHFLGLSKFERAADILEEQLVEISAETSPLRNSDLHVQLLQKYGGILWWDGDAEGAIDAYAAADEVLTERGAEKDTGLLLQRAKLWGKVAQVHRKSGDLEAADRHLEAAMYSLEQLRDKPSGSEADSHSVALEDLLRDLQASLGQVCVEKKEYGRAQELYLMAFSCDEKKVQTGPSLLGDLPSLVKQDSKSEKKEKHKIRIESRSVVDCPEDMRCAIDGKVMVNPVQSPYGHFFERKTLEKWFANCGSVCPITQKSLRLEECQADPEMKKRIVKFLKGHQVSVRQIPGISIPFPFDPAMVSQFNRQIFRLQPIQIASWHQLGATTHRTFLRELTDRLLLGQAGVGGEHRFAADRVYWFSRPKLPGSFEAGVITVEQRSFDARLVLGLFAPGVEVLRKGWHGCQAESLILNG